MMRSMVFPLLRSLVLTARTWSQQSGWGERQRPYSGNYFGGRWLFLCNTNYISIICLFTFIFVRSWRFHLPYSKRLFFFQVINTNFFFYMSKYYFCFIIRLERHLERKAWVASFGRPKMTPQSLLASQTGVSPYLR